MHKPLFDMKSIICKVDQITRKGINQEGVIDGFCIALLRRERRKHYIYIRIYIEYRTGLFLFLNARLCSPSPGKTTHNCSKNKQASI